MIKVWNKINLLGATNILKLANLFHNQTLPMSLPVFFCDR